MVGKVSPAVDAAICPMAARQIRLEGLRTRHSDHGRSWRAVQKWTASPGRLTGEAPQHTGECRGGSWVGQQIPEQPDKMTKITQVFACLYSRCLPNICYKLNYRFIIDREGLEPGERHIQSQNTNKRESNRRVFHGSAVLPLMKPGESEMSQPIMRCFFKKIRG